MDRVQGTNILCHTPSLESDRAAICSVFHNTHADYKFACTAVSTNGTSEVHDPRIELQRAAMCLLCLQALPDFLSVYHVAVRIRFTLAKRMRVIEIHSPATSLPEKKALIIIGYGAGLTPEWSWM